ncbi:hypothetical protein HBI23_071230 [Parastagonospora nodorum]|nr:hypothetical protein HBI79_029030 [Parastagonospora nodorum]KAH5332126.1 hypothetical protein HBI12_051270 [Parastagonospora nodorum]KAH5433938.1 hypothetical protein HBI47_090320 [Parastagonospora nodorum]KAH5665361.1 hypothetical protein HBI23_071230 [Parastagonospora nodorum]KAH6229054.1 hypothetical protein HBI43_053440 [Parastagonospora nodorum]
MASAAPTLPKSKTGSSALTNPTPTTTSDTTTSASGHATSAHQQAEDAFLTATNPDFKHPDHVIPRRNYSGFTDLIIVCCHAIYLPGASDADFPLKSPHDERNWLLAPFQKSNPETGKPGEQSTFVAHAQAGLDALSIHPDNVDLEKNLLVFSGGRTKKGTDMSEARSYYHALLASELQQNHLGGGKTHALFARGRILLEEHATDSLQNLLFSILLFRRTTGGYPRQIRVVTHAFKARRVLELHATAIRWPEDRVNVQGIDPVMAVGELDETLEGEEKSGYALWDEDPLGAGEKLSGKRKQRGWNEGIVDELVEGLEEGVRDLVLGRVPEKVPWEST